MELESLVVPAANVTEEAGKLILTIKELWADANLSEHQQLLIAMLDAVYFDTKQTKLIIATNCRKPRHCDGESRMTWNDWHKTG
jgi:hypothetical protein